MTVESFVDKRIRRARILGMLQLAALPTYTLYTFNSKQLFDQGGFAVLAWPFVMISYMAMTLMPLFYLRKPSAKELQNWSADAG